MADKKLKNVKVIKEIRIRGKACPVGTVIAKDDEKSFKEPGEWKNLVAMERLEETNDPVGEPKKTASKTSKMPE